MFSNFYVCFITCSVSTTYLRCPKWTVYSLLRSYENERVACSHHHLHQGNTRLQSACLVRDHYYYGTVLLVTYFITNALLLRYTAVILSDVCYFKNNGDINLNF